MKTGTKIMIAVRLVPLPAEETVPEKQMMKLIRQEQAQRREINKTTLGLSNPTSNNYLVKKEGIGAKTLQVLV